MKKDILINKFLLKMFFLVIFGFMTPAGFMQTPDHGLVICKSCPDYNYVITPDTYWKTFGSSHMADECRMFLVPVIPGYRYTFKTGCGNGATAGYDTHGNSVRY